MAFTSSFATLPYFISPQGWCDRPSRLRDQRFTIGITNSKPHASTRCNTSYVFRPRNQSYVDNPGQSADAVCDKDKFQVILNVSQFKPNELDVKTVDNFIVIHGKHEEKSDEHGFVSREFTRKYIIPEGVEVENVTSSLSANGVLTLHAPRKALEPPPKNERIVPISLQQQVEE